MKIKILVLVLASFCQVAFSQNYTQNIKGKIVDKQSGSALPGVMVQLLAGDSSNVVASDVNGYYKLEKVPVGRVSVSFTFIGYSSVIKSNLVVTSGKELIINVEMEEAVNQLETVTIVSKKSKLEANNKNVVVSNIKLNPEQTQKFAGTFQDVSRMAANYAGIVPAGDQRNDIIVRGNSPLGILWRLDGINIPNPNHFGSQGTTGGPVSILNNNNLAGSDFLTGAFPAEYGNGIAGAFDLQMRTGNDEKFEFTGQLGLNGIELGIEGPFKKTSKASFMANYRHSTLGIMNAMGISFGVSAIPQYQDIAFKVDLPTKGKLGRFQLFGIGGLSTIELLDSKRDPDEWTFSNTGTDVYFKTQMGIAGLSHKLFLTPNTSWTNTLALSAAGSSIEADSLQIGTGIPSRTYNNNSLESKLSFVSVLNTKFSAKSTLKNGVILDYLGSNFKEEVLSQKYGGWIDIVNFKGYSSLVQAYTQWSYKFNSKFLLNTGLHYQLFTLNNSQIIEPRIGMKYQLSDKQSVSLAGGQHSQIQPLRVYLLETNNLDGTSHKTNEELGFTKSIHGVLGYNNQISSDFRIKLETYYQYIYDTPVKENSYYSLANAGADFIFNDQDSLTNNGTGTNYGLELTFEKLFSKGYYFLINGSLYDSKYVGGDGVERSTAFNGQYTANILGGYEHKFNDKYALTFDGKVAFAGGKRYQKLDLNASIAAGTAVFDESSIFELKYTDYFRLDLKLGIRKNSKKLTQEFAFDVQNVTNQKNIFRQVFDAGTGTIKYEYQIGFFPVVLYKITF